MPTGYTAVEEEEDVTFKQYLLGCARAFGACFHRRDDGSLNQPEHQKESDYNKNSLLSIQEELKKLLDMTAEERNEAAKIDYLNRINDKVFGVARERRVKEANEWIDALYESMKE